jgi:hypothetical protein
MRVGPLLYSAHHARYDAFVPPAVAIVNSNHNIPYTQSLSFSLSLSLLLSLLYCPKESC